MKLYLSTNERFVFTAKSILDCPVDVRECPSEFLDERLKLLRTTDHSLRPGLADTDSIFCHEFMNGLHAPLILPESGKWLSPKNAHHQ
jgi:hypothetical protein